MGGIVCPDQSLRSVLDTHALVPPCHAPLYTNLFDQSILLAWYCVVRRRDRCREYTDADHCPPLMGSQHPSAGAGSPDAPGSISMSAQRPVSLLRHFASPFSPIISSGSDGSARCVSRPTLTTRKKRRCPECYVDPVHPASSSCASGHPSSSKTRRMVTRLHSNSASDPRTFT